MTDEQNDEILGRALARAIETQQVNETPYERSRLATRPARRGFPVWQALGAVAVLVLAVAFGSWFTRPGQTPVASTSTPTASPVATRSGTATPAPSGATVATRVFFVRDQLPPVSATLPSGGAHIPVDSVAERIAVAHAAAHGAVPGDAANPLAAVPLKLDGTSVQVSIDGDVATVQFDLPSGWGVHGAAQVQALVQQLVYLITEEPGIRKAHIVEKGKTTAVIDGLVVDRALAREDVTDYDEPGSTGVAEGYGDKSAAASRRLTTSTTVETLAPGLSRFLITTDLQETTSAVSYPDFNVRVVPNGDETARPGKWLMIVTVNGTDATTGDRSIDVSPLRSVATASSGANTVYTIGLDDLRPWRTAVMYKPFRIIVDIGGDPRMISAKNAVYLPRYGATVARTFSVTGIEHNFEANVVIRVRDDRQQVVLETSTTGTNCCDPGGTFEKTIELPAGVSGRITLEVLEVSPKDGSDQAVIRIPLTVR